MVRARARARARARPRARARLGHHMITAAWRIATFSSTHTHNTRRYFANVLFAQLITVSPHTLPVPVKKTLLVFMEEFLEQADHKEIREEEVKNGYKWSTLVPFMKLAYHPHSRRWSRREREQRNDLSDEERLRLDRYVYVLYICMYVL